METSVAPHGAVSSIPPSVLPTVLPNGLPTTQPLSKSSGVEVRAAAISVQGARVTYPFSKAPVLNGLDMQVAEGTIYGLLGASGCGKTTLLTCIVGRRRLDEGSVRVLGMSPGTPGSGLPGPTVGYMPQELALHNLFTVEETFRYFGWVAGMSQDAIRNRTDELLRILALPERTRLVGELSGGQQRRVSLGIALQTRPPILILDEPTVGVDPMLRQSIWDLLLEETRTGQMTVMITTHYIEEARQSHKVGLMRDGVLLDEDSPSRLLTRYSCASMEDVFLKLSIRQQRQQQIQGGEADVIPLTDTAVVAVQEVKDPDDEQIVVDDPSLLRSKPVVLRNHSNVIPCTWKMLVFTWRNRLVTGAMTFLPIIICMLFGLCVGGDPNSLHLAVVNEDFRCADSPPAFPADCDTEAVTGLSCRLLGLLGKEMFILDEYDDLPAALVAVQSGRAWGYLHFPVNYSTELVARHRDGKEASNETLVRSEVSASLDMSNQEVGDLMRLQLITSSLKYFEEVVMGCKGNPNYKAVPMQIKEPIYGKLDVTFQDFFAPAVILSVVFNMNAIYTMSGFVDDQRDGFVERSISSGVKMLDILGAHVLVDSIMMVTITVLTLAVMCGYFQTVNYGSMWTLILLCVINGYGGMFKGYFISSLFPTDLESTFVFMGLYLPVLVLSGLMWPLEGMHPLLRSAVWLLPMNLSTTAVRAIMGRGWGLEHRVVVNGFISSVTWLVFFVVVTLVTLRFRRRRA